MMTIIIRLSFVLLLTFSSFKLNASQEVAPGIVRLAIVNSPAYSGLIKELLHDFEKQTGLRADVYSGSNVYEYARSGQADIIISHYGKLELESFVLDGYGLWPKAVFFNQAVLIGHPSDPAKIRGVGNAAQAYEKIALAKAPFIENNISGVKYLADILWERVGQPNKQGWVIEENLAKGRAMQLAEDRKGYVIWGAIPFLRYKQKKNSNLEILVSDDPILQRMMVSVVANPAKIDGVNHEGASALQNFLISPKTQANIAAFRIPDTDFQLWWPAGRNN